MLPQALGGVVNPKLQCVPCESSGVSCHVLTPAFSLFRVYGTKGLRIVDVGVLPLEISSHTMSTAYAVALKAADLILA